MHTVIVVHLKCIAFTRLTIHFCIKLTNMIQLRNITFLFHVDLKISNINQVIKY